MKSNKLKTGIIMGMIAFLFTFSTNAQSSKQRQSREKPPTFKQLLKEMDANEDGKLSAKEIKGPLKDEFAKVDTNEDGFITKDEFEKGAKPKRQGKRN